MSDWRIFETRQFQDLESIARVGRDDVATKLRSVVYPQLRPHPHHGPHVRRLRAHTPETWRYRIGAWRFFYEIDETERIVSMIAAAHRGSAY